MVNMILRIAHYCVQLSWNRLYFIQNNRFTESCCSSDQKNELKEGFQRSSWCFRVPERPLHTREYAECGIRDNGQELLSEPHLLGKKFKPMAANKYFKSSGMEEPYGWGIIDNL